MCKVRDVVMSIVAVREVALMVLEEMRAEFSGAVEYPQLSIAKCHLIQHLP